MMKRETKRVVLLAAGAVGSFALLVGIFVWSLTEVLSYVGKFLEANGVKLP